MTADKTPKGRHSPRNRTNSKSSHGDEEDIEGRKNNRPSTKRDSVDHSKSDVDFRRRSSSPDTRNAPPSRRPGNYSEKRASTHDQRPEGIRRQTPNSRFESKPNSRDWGSKEKSSAHGEPSRSSFKKRVPDGPRERDETRSRSETPSSWRPREAHKDRESKPTFYGDRPREDRKPRGERNEAQSQRRGSAPTPRKREDHKMESIRPYVPKKTFREDPKPRQSSDDRGDHRFGNTGFSDQDKRPSTHRGKAIADYRGPAGAPKRKPFARDAKFKEEGSFRQNFVSPRESDSKMESRNAPRNSFKSAYDRKREDAPSRAKESNPRSRAVKGQESSYADQPRAKSQNARAGKAFPKERLQSPSTFVDKSQALNKGPLEETCKIKKECGSCSLINLPYESSLQTKYESGLAKLSAFTPKAKVHAVVPSSRPLGYRSHVKLAVRRNADGGVDIGLFQPGTHQVVNLERCPVQTGNINHFVRKFRELITTLDIKPYDETDGSGWLRYIAIRSSHFSGELMITLVITAHDEPLARKIHQFLRKNEEKFASLHFNINAEPGNVIFGKQTIHIGGADSLSESLCGLKFEVSPLSFFQVNPWQTENLYRTIERYAGTPSDDSVAWDLYSGCGQIALLLARAGYRTLGIEEVPEAIIDARANATRNGLKVEFIEGRVEDSQWDLPKWSKSPSFIVANPSRRGMAEITRKTLANLPTERNCTLIYVSCEVDTLARDLVDLTSGGFKVKQIIGFDMFAQTSNLEWVVVLAP
ncbi:MAG: 23S rRNA (uracil(1939)-C(5))-methyltransferase RlmD [Pseudomonadota bacterium]